MPFGLDEDQTKNYFVDRMTRRIKTKRGTSSLRTLNDEDVKVLSEAIAFVIAENNTKIMQDLKDAGYNPMKYPQSISVL